MLVNSYPRYALFFGLLGIYLMFAIQNEVRHITSPVLYRILAKAVPRSNVCICLADDRFSQDDLELAAIKSYQELREFIEQDSEPLSEWGYWRKTALINAAYALKFNHPLILSNLSTYQTILPTYPRGSTLRRGTARSPRLSPLSLVGCAVNWPIGPAQ